MNGETRAPAWRAGEIVTVQYRVTHDHDDEDKPVSVELVGTGMMTGIWPENLRAAALASASEGQAGVRHFSVELGEVVSLPAGRLRFVHTGDGVGAFEFTPGGSP